MDEVIHMRVLVRCKIACSGASHSLFVHLPAWASPPLQRPQLAAQSRSPQGQGLVPPPPPWLKKGGCRSGKNGGRLDELDLCFLLLRMQHGHRLCAYAPGGNTRHVSWVSKGGQVMMDGAEGPQPLIPDGAEGAKSNRAVVLQVLMTI